MHKIVRGLVYLLFVMLVIVGLMCFWDYVGNATNWFGTRKQFESYSYSFVPIISLLSCWAIFLIAMKVSELIYGPPKPFKDYDRKDMAKVLEMFLQEDYEDEADFGGIESFEFEDPIILKAAARLKIALENPLPTTRDKEELRALRCDLLGDA
ncbi:MAG: hypothetical protein K2Y22_06835 [Candidatus Obscuribacterales bacterium]|nr:hypothetical protein [Candidatus Obscuribacterales bacterium]